MQERPENFGEKDDSFYTSHLIDGGEMGELTLNYDWSKTPVGHPRNWPASLLTTLSIILHSKFPMFLFWGPEHLCFYNDAYRPSLGNNGKHPYALGKKGEEIWPEIWPDIKPLIDNVLAAKGASWSEDQLLPIYRNGHLEDAYWTFSYSPVTGEAGKPAGVFVTLVETTEKVSNAKKIEESEHRYQTLIEESTVAVALYTGREMRIQYANDIMYNYWGKDNSVIGKTIREILPELENQHFHEVLDSVYIFGKPYVGIEEKADLLVDGKLQSFYFNFTYKALHKKDGEIYGIYETTIDVTEQVLARQRIQEAEEKARLAIASAELGVYEIIYETNAIYPDARFNEIWGFNQTASRPEYAAAIHPDDLQTREQAHKESITAGQLNYEARVIWKDKSVHWLRIKGKVIFDETGKPLKLIGVVQDVTGQVIATKKIEESERNIRNMILQAPVAMCILRSPLFNIEIANTRMFELWGKAGSELINKPIFEALHEAKEQGLEQLLSNVFTTGERFVADERPVKLPRNGKIETVYINFVYEALREGDGTISGILVVAIDVTAQVVTRQKTEAAEERARLAITSAQLGVFEIDLASNNAVTDARFNEICGLEHSVTWKGIAKIIHPDDLKERQKAHKAAAQTGILDYETRIYKKDKSISWIRIKGIALLDEAGKLTKLLGVIQDITKQKNFAEALEKKVWERTKELAEANLQLQQSNVELNQFAYIASHDLQEPLRKVRTFTDLMQLSLGDVPDKAKNYINKIQNSTERMQTLINDVLKFSLLSKERENFANVDLNNILIKVLDDYELLIEQKGAKITAEILPSIEAISLQMSQLFTNIISNALKFSSKERNLEIFIRAQQLQQKEVQKYKELNKDKIHYLIEFKDNGIGFSQENANQIFTIFQRLHGKTEYSGTGIGLAMCKKITLNHHGTIYAKSLLNEGTSFIIILPQTQY